MTPIERIKAAGLQVLPAPEPDQVQMLRKKVGLPLPKELRGILSCCSGIDGFLGEIDFTGLGGYEQKDIFPNGLPFGADGDGNFWVLDLTPATIEAAPVFFACHDAPIILYQSPDIASFLDEVVSMTVSPRKCLIHDILGDRLFHVWRKNPGVVDQAAAATSADLELRHFAAGLPEYYQIIDLRAVSPGMGFSWGRYDPESVRRHGYERIFAYAKPPETGFFAGLFGRGKRTKRSTE